MSRGIDCLIAEHVFDWEAIAVDEDGQLIGHWDDEDGGNRSVVPQYSKHDVYALAIIEKLNYLSFSINRESCSGVRWDVEAYNDLGIKEKWAATCQDSLAMAVCLVALKSKGVVIPYTEQDVEEFLRNNTELFDQLD